MENFENDSERRAFNEVWWQTVIFSSSQPLGIVASSFKSQRPIDLMPSFAFCSDKWIDDNILYEMFRLPHVIFILWCSFTINSTEIACLCYHCHSSTASSYVTGMLHRKSLQPTTLAPAHTPCLFSIDLHTVGQHLVIVYFFCFFFCLELYSK